MMRKLQEVIAFGTAATDAATAEWKWAFAQSLAGVERLFPGDEPIDCQSLQSTTSASSRHFVHSPTTCCSRLHFGVCPSGPASSSSQHLRCARPDQGSQSGRTAQESEPQKDSRSAVEGADEQRCICRKQQQQHVQCIFSPTARFVIEVGKTMKINLFAVNFISELAATINKRKQTQAKADAVDSKSNISNGE